MEKDDERPADGEQKMWGVGWCSMTIGGPWCCGGRRLSRRQNGWRGGTRCKWRATGSLGGCVPAFGKVHEYTEICRAPVRDLSRENDRDRREPERER
jgi:hypothetical protein